jgi:arylsulfatase A-like enzyme
VHPDHEPTSYGYDSYRGRVYDGQRGYEAWRAGRHPDVPMPAAWFGDVDLVPLAHARTHWLARHAVEALGELAEIDGPWHLRVDFPEPHLPPSPVREFADRYDPQAIEPWGSFADDFAGKPFIQQQMLRNWDVTEWTWSDWAPVVARYFAIIEQTDDAIGLVLAELRKLGAEGDTIVVYTTDHGDMCGAHRMVDKHCVLYDDVLRVPLVVSWPDGALAAGTVRDEFVYNLLDLPPTLHELAGVPPDPLHAGRSLVPLLRGAEPATPWREEVLATYNGQQFGLFTERAIRNRRWKYVWNATDVDELYDLAADPHELRNVIDQPEHRDELDELRRTLYAGLVEFDDQVDNPWVAHQLLGGEPAWGSR